MRPSNKFQGIGIALVLVSLVFAPSSASPSSVFTVSEMLEYSAPTSSELTQRGALAVDSSNELAEADLPVSDLVPRNRVFQESGLSNAPKIPQLRVSDQKITLISTAILTSVGIGVLICDLNPAGCIAYGCVLFTIAWLAVFFVDGHEVRPTNNPAARHFLEPGDHHMLNVGEGFFELDSLLIPFVDNDTLAVAHLRGHLDDMRTVPHHTLELLAFEETTSIIVHLHHNDTRLNTGSSGEDGLNNRDSASANPDKKKHSVMVNRIVYNWNRSNKNRYHKLGKRNERKADGKKLGNALGRYIYKQRRQAYCTTFHDEKSGNDVNKGTVYLNKGKGVSKHCESKNSREGYKHSTRLNFGEFS